MQALTPKCGLNRHTPHAVIFGPSKYGGLARPDLWTEQAIEHLRVTLLVFTHRCENLDFCALFKYDN